MNTLAMPVGRVEIREGLTVDSVVRRIGRQVKKVGAMIKKVLVRIDQAAASTVADPYMPESFFKTGYCGRLYV